MKSSLTVGVDGGGTVALLADLDLDEPPVHPVLSQVGDCRAAEANGQPA